MIPINDLLFLFNQFSTSNIRPIVAPIIVEIDKRDLAKDNLEEKINEALEKSQYPFLPLEKVEISLHAAAAQNGLALFMEADKTLNGALEFTGSYSHPRMIILWALGINALWMDDHSLSFQYWSICRDTLQDILSGRTDIVLKRDMQDWYKRMLSELNQTMSQTCIQEIYAWIGAFETSHLSEETITLSEKIFKAITDQDIQEANRLMDRASRYISTNRDYLQNREVLIILGLTKYLIKEYEVSLKLMGDAIAQLEPKSKQQAVAYWLKGMILEKIPDKKDDGVISLRKSMDLFQELRVKADQKQKTPLVGWFDEKLAIMENEIEHRRLV